MILMQAWMVKKIVGTWLVPACLFGLFWFALTFLPLLLLYTLPIDPLAVGFILLCTVAFSMGSLAFHWKSALRRNASKSGAEALYGSTFLSAAFHTAVVASLVLIVMNATAQGISRSDLILRLFASAEMYASLRYADELVSPMLERWSVVAAYIGVIVGGLRVGSASAMGRKRITLLAFLPPVAIALTQSAAWPFLLSIAFFSAGILVYRISQGRLYLIGRESAGSLVLSAVAAVLVVLAVFVSRGTYAADSSEISRFLAGRAASYTSGHLYAFSDWFAYALDRQSLLSYHPSNTTPGFYTFATIYRMLGSDEFLPLGTYDDGYLYGGIVVSNVFTMFRGLITDFGHAGALLFMVVIGVVFHAGFYALLVNRRPAFPVAFFIFTIGFFFSSFVVSMLGSNIIYYVILAVTWIVLAVNKLVVARPA
jgi:oligosaccharide repeat unit polymerase